MPATRGTWVLPRRTSQARRPSGHDDLRRPPQPPSTSHQLAIIEAHELAAACAAYPVQGVCEIETLPVKVDGVFYRLPALDGHMWHPQQVLDGFTERIPLDVVEAPHHPLQFQDDGERDEDGL